jgi:hypothetical protein
MEELMDRWWMLEELTRIGGRQAMSRLGKVSYQRQPHMSKLSVMGRRRPARPGVEIVQTNGVCRLQVRFKSSSSHLNASNRSQ